MLNIRQVFYTFACFISYYLQEVHGHNIYTLSTVSLLTVLDNLFFSPANCIIDTYNEIKLDTCHKTHASMLDLPLILGSSKSLWWEYLFRVCIGKHTESWHRLLRRLTLQTLADRLHSSQEHYQPPANELFDLAKATDFRILIKHIIKGLNLRLEPLIW